MDKFSREGYRACLPRVGLQEYGIIEGLKNIVA